ncbi:MAG TPA: alpha-L-fucosidase [Phycisphaerae bacterium]|nr:alpha-L-fucosidase [Phycisphaerae bacterium]
MKVASLMLVSFCCVCLMLVGCSTTSSASSPENTAMSQTVADKDAKMAWWREAKFGMFIHWGIYAVPAGEWKGKDVRGPGEWIQTRGRIPGDQYDQLAKQFNPVDFNADQWASIAQAAGVKYIVITSKHHDGFCMFDTHATNFNVVAATPWHQDPLAQLDAACLLHGIRFCTYYSIMDWHTPDQSPHRPSSTAPEFSPTNMVPGKNDAYVAYMKAQLGELITGYHPSLIWFDGGWVHGWTAADAQTIYDYIQSCDPSIIVNNRLLYGVGDYGTPEQHIPNGGEQGDWETCMTINETWGYMSRDKDFKSAGTLITNLIKCVSGGGNYLLNIGPDGLGRIPEPEVQRLLAIGAWLKVNGDAIYGTTGSPFKSALPFGYATQKPGKIFLEITDWPTDGILRVPLSNVVIRAYLLTNPNSSLQVSPLLSTDGGGTQLVLPANAPDPVASVVVLEISGDPQPL